jgi:phosphoglycolate phosphatase
MPIILNKNLPNPPKAIIFDWDGVLVETTDFIKQAFIHTQQTVRPHLEVQTELPGLSLRDYFPSFFGEKATVAEKIFYDYVEKNHLSVLKPTPGASDLLGFLAEQAYPLFVISNKKGELLRKEVDYLSWAGYFKRVIGSGDCLEDKPSALPVKIVLGHFHMEPSRDVWFVGDSAVDMQCAGESGCSALFVHPRREQESLINMEFPADAVVFSCKDLQNIVINNKL